MNPETLEQLKKEALQAVSNMEVAQKECQQPPPRR